MTAWRCSRTLKVSMAVGVLPRQGGIAASPDDGHPAPRVALPEGTACGPIAKLDLSRDSTPQRWSNSPAAAVPGANWDVLGPAPRRWAVAGRARLTRLGSAPRSDDATRVCARRRAAEVNRVRDAEDVAVACAGPDGTTSAHRRPTRRGSDTEAHRRTDARLDEEDNSDVGRATGEVDVTVHGEHAWCRCPVISAKSGSLMPWPCRRC